MGLKEVISMFFSWKRDSGIHYKVEKDKNTCKDKSVHQSTAKKYCYSKISKLKLLITLKKNYLKFKKAKFGPNLTLFE